MEISLVTETDPILRKRAEEVTEFNDSLRDLVVDMLGLMHENHGLGLAAPQIGVGLRVFVMGDSENQWACVNPSIIEASPELDKGIEGCLSFPGIFVKVPRPKWVKVRYQNIGGNWFEETLTDMWSRVYCHELDHLDGITFDRRASRVAFDLAKRKRNKKVRMNNER